MRGGAPRGLPEPAGDPRAMPFRLIAAPHTPLTGVGELHLAMVRRQAEHLAAEGVKGVFIGGSTGEYASLTVNERMRLAEEWMAHGPPHGLEVMVHVGHNCQRDAMDLAAHASRLRPQAIAALAPGYFKPAGVDDLVAFFEPIAAAAEAPFFFYDIPTMSGVNLSTVDFLRKASQRIPTLAGVKFTNPDLMQFQECVAFEDQRFEILYGCDEQLLAGYALGARGGVGSTYNFAAPLYLNMIAAFDRGEQESARKLQAQSVELVRTLQASGYMASAKTLMSLLGIDCGPVRPPLRNLTDAQRLDLSERLLSLGIYRHLDPG